MWGICEMVISPTFAKAVDANCKDDDKCSTSYSSSDNGTQVTGF